MSGDLRFIDKPRRREDDRWRRNLPSARRRRAFPFGLLAFALLCAAGGLYLWQPAASPFRLASAALYGPGETVAKKLPALRRRQAGNLRRRRRHLLARRRQDQAG